MTTSPNTLSIGILLALIISTGNMTACTQDNNPAATPPKAVKTAVTAYSFPNADANQILFSFYSLEEPELSLAKQNGVSAIGPYYVQKGPQKTFERAGAAKLPALYTLGKRIDFSNYSATTQAAALASLKAEVATVSKSPEIIAWALASEELRYWRAAEMEWLEQATDIIRQNDAAGRPILMYEPNHRSADALIKTSKYLDFVAKGTYANLVGMKNKRTWVRWSIEQAVEAANQTSTIPLAVLYMAKDQKSNNDIAAIRNWTRHDVYLSLLTGAKGIIVWSGWSKRAGFQQHFNDFYDGYISAARELNIAPGFAPIFLRGTPLEGIQAIVTKGPASQTFTFQDSRYTYPTLSYKQYGLDEKNYLFLINSADEPCRVTISGLPNNSTILNAFNNEPVNLDKGEIIMDAFAITVFSWATNKK